ncbi:MAG: hypothetical protein JWQ07_3971 [Ramlibacter sp.]|nr:hypothetical protein [Ramlibacter sp.]
MDSLEGKLIVVSGAASAVGRSCVDRLMRAQARVHVIDSDSAGLSEMLKRYNAQGRLTGACSSLATPKACADALSGLQQPIYGVLHVAGDQETPAADDTLPPEWDHAIAADLAAAWQLADGCQPRLDEGQACRIVLTSPAAPGTGSAGEIASGSVYGGLARMVRLLARSLAPRALVNGIAVGLVETLGTRDSLLRGSDAVRDGVMLRRWAQPDEIAAVAQFLLGAGSSYVTGQVIHCDGGACYG